MRDATRNVLTAWISRRPSPTSRSNGWTDGRTLYWGLEVMGLHTDKGPRIRRPYSPVTSRGAREMALTLARMFPGAVHCGTNAEVLGQVAGPDGIGYVGPNEQD